MSNRSLMEFNHDLTGAISRHQRQFLDALESFLRSASRENAEQLERFGVTVFGTRKHYDGFDIKWGAHKASENAAPDGYQPK